MRSEPPRTVIAEAIADWEGPLDGFGFLSRHGRAADLVIRRLREEGYAIVMLAGDQHAVIPDLSAET